MHHGDTQLSANPLFQLLEFTGCSHNCILETEDLFDAISSQLVSKSAQRRLWPIWNIHFDVWEPNSDTKGRINLPIARCHNLLLLQLLCSLQKHADFSKKPFFFRKTHLSPLLIRLKDASYFHKGLIWRGVKVEKSRKTFLDKSRKVLAMINDFLMIFFIFVIRIKMTS